MKHAGIGLALLAATVAALIVFFAFTSGSDAPGEDEALALASPTLAVTATATPIPPTWLEALGEPPGAPPSILVSCGDANGDLLLDAADDAALDASPIALQADLACLSPDDHADFYAGQPFSAEARSCDGAVAPVEIVLAASAGSDLLQPREGESLGMIDIARDMRAQLEDGGADVSVMVAASAVFGADMPQTSMERWLAARVRQRLSDVPCAGAVIIGHSHGGVTATSVAAALEGEYADRMLVVLIDRSAVLYDRQPEEMPQRARVLNFYQLNEGWHGEPIDQPNVENIDESDERAPIAPSDGGGGLALVSHKTLDDALAVQRAVVARSVGWALGG